MNTTISDFNLFIKSYRKMELESSLKNKLLIKNTICDIHFNDVWDTWQQSENNFGKFYLNLSFENQGAFLKKWGLIMEPYYNDYVKNIQKDPNAFLYIIPPKTIIEIRALILYFCNYSIDTENSTILSLSKKPLKTYGNSSNWGDFILALPSEESEKLYSSLNHYVNKETASVEKQIKLFEENYI